MAQNKDHGQGIYPEIVEVTERLDEQHIFTTKTLGFLIHPNIPAPGPQSKIADVGTGTGIWLLDVAKTVPPTVQLVGFDATPSSFPSSSVPPNVSFKIQDMHRPFPDSELGTYDLVAVRFVSSAAGRGEWADTVRNLMTLLKPGGWMQWIDSCGFALYNSVPGTSRRACREIFEGLEPFRKKGEEIVIGLMMRGGGDVQREKIWEGVGLVDVHEDVFSTDRLQDPELRLRERGTRNVIVCFTGCLESLVGTEGSGWTRERIRELESEAMREIGRGVYHTLDQVCIVGRKPGGSGV
ncbi:S-adenosyl-L-methionine-dependent methyltransferase [Echria macrotheca]|uniref:S-adenosyl-L-methionine-dependent methyltransferase n=1 Tax=Echria macrotheca TaxID=438768 RepID=A0AAJ0BE98_9PEZI|nr:S-adenosyl-L-methionine-dependent methyltransferase [Echria macrotheca]